MVETASLPTYHIAGVRVRNSRAQVDIVWPTERGANRSSTIWLEGGLQPWSVKRVQEWNEGVIATPELYFIRAGEAPVSEAPVSAETEPVEQEAPPAADNP
jgi:hypothetical protein